MTHPDDDQVEIYPAPEDMQVTARKLLDASDDPDHEVQTVSGGFRVPAAVAKKAGLGGDDESKSHGKAPAKKQPAKAPASGDA